MWGQVDTGTETGSRGAVHRSFLPSLLFFASCCSDWSSRMATMTYAMSTTLAMMAAVAPAKVELPGLVS